MYLYHGSNALVRTPDFKFAKEGRDFGVGFYLTSLKKQAEEWALFVKNCRLQINDKISNCDLKYDIVVGEVANDRMYVLFELFEAGDITAEMFAATLKYTQGSNQYSFHTERPLSYIMYLDSYIVGGKDE